MPEIRTLQFKFTLLRELPKLAWCLRLDRKSAVAEVLHGEWLEKTGTWFCDGAWAGDFAQPDFDRAFATGTGAILQDNSILFVAPSHTLDRLNVLQRPSEILVSNSLPFLLAMANDQLDNTFLFYDSYVASIRYGLNRYEQMIPTMNGNGVRFYYGRNLRLTDNFELTEIRRPPAPHFVGFDHYKRVLDETISALVANATDVRRRIRFEPISTVSRGYDSPTALVLAMGAGCREAVSFRESRNTDRDEDCGTPIAISLGVSVREFGRLDYRNFDDFPEVQNSGGPSEFLSFGSAFSGRLVFTGFHGDKMWDKNCEKVTTDLVRGDASGASLTEFRLSAGFLHLPVPFIAAESHPSIYAISNSQEMLPWSLGTSYDRPIARRIVESAGVARELFGQKKRAAGVVVTSEGLAKTMGEPSLVDFRAYLAEHWDPRFNRNVRWLQIARKLGYYNDRVKRVGARLGRAIGLRRVRVPELLPHRVQMLVNGYLGHESLLFHWGMDKLVRRYSQAIQKATQLPGQC
jgi:hypothetical protein